MFPSSRIRTLLADHGDAAVFLTALIVRLAWTATLENHLDWFDEREFGAIARHLVDGDGYVSSSFRANPTVSVYLALIFRFFGENYAVARIGQCLIAAATCVVIARTAREFAGPAAALFSGFLLAVYPPHVFLSGVFYVDTWLTFFCAVTVYLTVLIARGAPGGLAMALLCGVTQGLAMLTRPAFAAFLPGPMLAWIVSEAPLRARRALLCGVFVLGAAVTVLPWVYRNYEVFGRPMIASGFWVMLWRGNHELANGSADDRLLHWGTSTWEDRLRALPEERQRELQAEYLQLDRRAVERTRALGDADLALDDVLRPLALDAIASHPGRTLRLAVKKVGTLFSAFTESSTTQAVNPSGDRSIAAYRWLAPLSFYPLLAMTVVGAVFGWPRRRELAPIYFLIMSVTVTYALLTACTRFRLPLDPFLIILSSLAAVRMVEVLRRAPAASRRSEPGAVGRAAPATVAARGQGRVGLAGTTTPRCAGFLCNDPDEGRNHA